MIEKSEWWNEEMPEPTVDNRKAEKYAEELRKLEVIDIKPSRRERKRKEKKGGEDG
jgi:hypothetical protein